VCEKYKIKAREIFRNVYSHDRPEVEMLAAHMRSQGIRGDIDLPDYAELWQNTFEILSIGTVCEPGLMP